tara:strand:+ start:18111 stop:18974 length:864 start_codon:yes stop_codon:yes gene_type:complete
MLNKLVKIHILILAILCLSIGCSSSKKDSLNKTRASHTDNTIIHSSSTTDHESEFSSQQLNYQIKKLNAEINYLKEQFTALDVKSSLYADPFDIYNKEIMLDNGSSIFCKILSQTDQEIFVETLIGNLTIKRANVIRIVENITVLEGERDNSNIVEINMDEEQAIISDAELIKQRQIQSSASIILLGDILESKDKSGNTIFEGELKNIGTQRADLVRIDFILRKNFQGDIETLTTYASGSSHVFKNSGIISNSSITPGAIGTFKLIVPNEIGNFIGYSYQVEWDFYE